MEPPEAGSIDEISIISLNVVPEVSYPKYDPKRLVTDEARLFLPAPTFSDWDAALNRAQNTTLVPWQHIAAAVS